MSKKDVIQYYDQITNDYLEMVNTLKEMEQLAEDKLINPDRVDEIRKMIEPLKNNYLRISYIMFLLNKPTKKEKREIYEQQNKEILTKLNSMGTESAENKKVIDELNTTWLAECTKK